MSQFGLFEGILTEKLVKKKSFRSRMRHGTFGRRWKTHLSWVRSVDSRRTGHHRFQSANQVQSTRIEAGTTITQQSAGQIADCPLPIHDDPANNVQLKKKEEKIRINSLKKLKLWQLYLDDRTGSSRVIKETRSARTGRGHPLEHGFELGVSAASRATSPITGNDGQQTSVDLSKLFLIFSSIAIGHLQIQKWPNYFEVNGIFRSPR